MFEPNLMAGAVGCAFLSLALFFYAFEETKKPVYRVFLGVAAAFNGFQAVLFVAAWLNNISM